MRWGKPTKNKKRRDPRYFLNESNELQEGLIPAFSEVREIVCPNKKWIIMALDHPEMARFLAGGLIKDQFAELMVAVSGGMVDKNTARLVVEALDDVMGAELQKLATDPSVKPMIKQAITFGCSMNLPF
jgi:hypothetical protein